MCMPHLLCSSTCLAASCVLLPRVQAKGKGLAAECTHTPACSWLQITLKDASPAVTFENPEGDRKWQLQPRAVDVSLRLEERLAPGFTSLVISSTENATQVRQAVLTSSAIGGGLTVNQVRRGDTRAWLGRGWSGAG